METEEWLVYTLTEDGHGGVYLWWCPGRSYTRYLEHAGRYTEEEVRRIVADGREVAVRLADAKAKAVSVVPCGALEPAQGLCAYENRTIR